MIEIPNKTALFTFDGTFYWPSNKNAVGICAILSRRKIMHFDMQAVRSHGYEPRLANGEVIGKVDITV